jgi:hypothetical protein
VIRLFDDFLWRGAAQRPGRPRWAPALWAVPWPLLRPDQVARVNDHGLAIDSHGTTRSGMVIPQVKASLTRASIP